MQHNEYLLQMIQELEVYSTLGTETNVAQSMVDSLSTNVDERVRNELLDFQERNQAFDLSKLSQINAEDFIKNQVQDAFKRLGITEKINLCDNPLGDIIAKIAQIIEDLTQTLEDVVAAITGLLSFLNLPENIKTFLAAILAQFYCNFKTMRITSVQMLPDLIDKIKIGDDEIKMAPKPGNEPSPSAILQRLIKLREDLINIVSQSQADLNENVYDRYKDNAAQLQAIIKRLKTKLDKSKKFQGLLEDEKHTLVNMPPLKEVKPGGQDYTINKQNTYAQSLDFINSLTNTTVPGLMNNNLNINTTSRVCYDDLRKLIDDVADLVNDVIKLID